MFNKLAGIATAVALLGVTGSANATVSFNQDVTSNAIFGSGNANGFYTVDRSNGIELGLRGKLRFNASNLAENTFNSNGDGTYSFAPGLPPTGFSFAPNSPTTPVWNFEWSINSNFDGTSGLNLNDLIYQISIDFDNGAGTNFLQFDPINVVFFDHSIGTNATGNGAGTEAANAGEYATLIDENNLAQNSWNMEFFNDAPFDIFDPALNGLYTIRLEAFNQQQELVSSVSIDIIVGTGAPVSEPAALSLLGIGLLGLGVMARRRRGA